MQRSANPPCSTSPPSATPLLNGEQPPSHPAPAAKTPPFRDGTGTPYTHHRFPSGAEFQGSKCCLRLRSPGPPFLPAKRPCPGCQRTPSHSSGVTYARSSADGSGASEPLPKRGMSPKPQERCREPPSPFPTVTTTSTTAAMPGWFKEVWK